MRGDPGVAASALLLGLALTVASCAGPGGSARTGSSTGSSTGASAAAAFTIKGTDSMKFEPAQLTVKAGQPVALTLQNVGQVEHSVVVRKGSAAPIRASVAPGKSGTINVTFDAAGSYEFTCDLPGHTEAGMKGMLVAQ